MIARSKSILRVLTAFLAFFAFTASLHLIRANSHGSADFPCGEQSDQSALIDIASGATGSDIARILYREGVIASSQAFFSVAVSDSRSQSISPGVHKISKKLCASQALDQLLDSKRIENLVRVFEGAWNSEIVEALVGGGFERQEVLTALKEAKLPVGISTLEGLLFPAQYSFATGTSARDAIAMMVDRGEKELQSLGIFGAQGSYSPQSLITIASIIQAEADESDFAKVSRVIRNRLEKGIPLQMDSTVHYIKSDRGKIFLSTKSTLLNSPYNTYQNYRLPPGPIGNPGRKALQAALSPEKGDWLYFITVSPGDTRFTASYDQFSQWKIEYKKNLRQGVFAKESR